MLYRRFLLSSGLTGGVVMLAWPAAADDMQAAASAVQEFATALVAIIDQPSDQPHRQDELRQLVERTVDIADIARFCLGRYASQASADQLRAFSAIFHDVMLHSIVSRLGNYAGAKLVIGRSSRSGTDTAVWSTVQRPNSTGNSVQWIVSSAAAGSKIVDLVVEGTSLRITTRSEYEGFLLHHDGDLASLIAAMRSRLHAAG